MDASSICITFAMMQNRDLKMPFYLRIFFKSIIILASLNYAAAMAQTPPKPLTRGIVSLETVDDDIIAIDETVEGKETLIAISDIPFAAIRGDRSGGSASGIECVQLSSSKRCIMPVSIEDKQETWLIEKAEDKDDWEAIQLPYIPLPYLEFFSDGGSNFHTDAPLSFISKSPDMNAARLIVAKSLKDAKNPDFVHIDFPANEIVTLMRVQSSQELLAFAAIIPLKINNPLPSVKDIKSLMLHTRSNGFLRVELPSDCIPLGALHDKIMCVSKTEERHADINLGDGISLVYIHPPENEVFDLERQAITVAPYVAAGRWAFLTALDKGVMRPVIWDSQTGRATWLDVSSDTNCFGLNRGAYYKQHAKVIGVTSGEDAVLMHIFNALTPTQFSIVPFRDGEIELCAPKRRNIYSEEAVYDHGVVNGGRFWPKKTTAAGNSVPPFIVYKNEAPGKLSGKLLIISYGVHGLVLPEYYIGAWGKYWYAQGGSIVIAHLPGGGGYGAEWVDKGSGIKGKYASAASLHLLRKQLEKNGFGKNGTSLLTESAGGPIAAYAASVDGAAYDAVILRAACLELSLEKRENCTRRADAYGDIDVQADRVAIAKFNVLEKLASSPDAPLFIFGIPETDTIIKRDYQIANAHKFAEDKRVIIDLPGVNHTDRLSPDGEDKWVKAAVDAIIANSDKQRELEKNP